MIRELMIGTLDVLLASYGRHVRRQRARKLSIESAFDPRTCERLLQLCGDDLDRARLAVCVAMLSNRDPVALVEELIEIGKRARAQEDDV